MYRMSRRVLCVLSLSAVLVCLTHFASAEQAIKFAASYQLANVVESGNQFDVTINLTLHNPSMTDVSGSIVVVYDAQPSHTFLNSFSEVKTIPHMGDVVLAKTLTVSAAEYALWQNGHDPVFKILVPTSNGTDEESVQVRRVNPGQSSN